MGGRCYLGRPWAGTGGDGEEEEALSPGSEDGIEDAWGRKRAPWQGGGMQGVAVVEVGEAAGTGWCLPEWPAASSPLSKQAPPAGQSVKDNKKKLKYSQILNGCACTYAFLTWPSHISSKEALSLVALASLLWNNFPSKKPQGQQWSHGKGCPHTSFTNRAVSTPLVNREASCTPRLSTFSTWHQCQREEIWSGGMFGISLVNVTVACHFRFHRALSKQIIDNLTKLKDSILF